MKTKTIKLILFVGLFIISLSSLKAQSKNTMELLCHAYWQHTYSLSSDDGIVSTYIFTPTTFTETAHYQSSVSEIIFSYYLSDHIENTFDKSKIGKVMNGKYIITLNKFDEISVAEIMNISETEFELSFVTKKLESRSSTQQGTTTYTAIPKAK